MNDIRLSLQDRRLLDVGRTLSGGISIGILPRPRRTSRYLLDSDHAIRRTETILVKVYCIRRKKQVIPASIQGSAGHEFSHEPAQHVQIHFLGRFREDIADSLPVIMVKVHRNGVVIPENEGSDMSQFFPAWGISAAVPFEPPIE